MNTTIAVALITAISTLSGATISGVITFLVTRTQAHNQVALADRNLSAQVEQERRNVQRDIYAQFLTKISEIQEKLVTWQFYPPTPITDPEVVIDALRSDLRELARLQHLVVIESPDSVAHAASELYRLLIDQAFTIAIEPDGESRTRTIKNMDKTRNKMIDAIRETLRGGDSDD